MAADLEELNRIRRRVERRVRGEIIYCLHCAFAIFCSVLVLISLTLDPNRFYHGGAVAMIILFFAFTVGTHALLRRLNRTADQLREKEMQRELQRAGYYGEIDKRKRDVEAFAHLRDDGELIYRSGEHKQASTANSFN